VAALRAELLRTDAEFAALSLRSGAPAAFSAYLADDAVSIENGGDFLRGKADIVAALAPAPGTRVTLRWEPLQADAAASGDLGYTFGRYSFDVVGADGASRVLRGKYMTVWRRGSDGAWRATVDMGNGSP